MVVNLALNVALIYPLKHMGPPLATAIASTVNVWLLYATLRKRGHFLPDARLKRRWWRLALAALAMGAVIWFLQPLLTPYVHGTWVVRIGAIGPGTLQIQRNGLCPGAAETRKLYFGVAGSPPITVVYIRFVGVEAGEKGRIADAAYINGVIAMEMVHKQNRQQREGQQCSQLQTL